MSNSLKKGVAIRQGEKEEISETKGGISKPGHGKKLGGALWQGGTIGKEGGNIGYLVVFF